MASVCPGIRWRPREDKLFVAGGNVLSVRRKADGAVVWSCDFSSMTYPSTNLAAIANGVVYIAADQQSSTTMFAFNTGDGTRSNSRKRSSVRDVSYICVRP